MQLFKLIDNTTIETTYVSICDPIFRSAFKIIFKKFPKRLINFLNSVYFLQINKKIISLEFKPNQFFEIDKINNDINERA